jgi:microcystin-dependent protein
MALPVRKGYKGAPAKAVLTSTTTTSDTSFAVDTVTGWATVVPFYCVVDAGTSKEEKVKVTAISGIVLTVVRAQDDTSAQIHNESASIYPVFTADEADEANEIASVMTTKGDLIATDGSSINRLNIGTNTHVLQADSASTNGFKWGQVATAGIADGAITAAKITDGTITSAKIADGTIVLADLAAALQNFLVPVGTIVATARVTAPTGWLLCDGTSTTGYTALAALVGAATPDMRGRFPIGDNSTLTLLGTGGSTTIAEGNLPSHTHTVSGTSDGMNQNSTPGHSVTDPGHNHTQSPHNHTQNEHDHSTNSVETFSNSLHLHDNDDYFAAAVNGGSVTGGGNTSIFPATATNQATTATNQATTATNQATTATNQATTATNIATVATNQPTGGGTDYYQPYLVVNYIIKHD